MSRLNEKFYENRFSPSEVIETIEFHCPSCSNRVRMFKPPGLGPSKDLVEHYKKVVESQAERIRLLEKLLGQAVDGRPLSVV